MRVWSKREIESIEEQVLNSQHSERHENGRSSMPGEMGLGVVAKGTQLPILLLFASRG